MAWREDFDIVVLLLFAGIAAWGGLYSLSVLGKAFAGVTLALVWYFLLPHLDKIGADDLVKKFFVAAFAWTLFAVSAVWLGYSLALVQVDVSKYVAALEALGYILGWISALIGTLLLGIRKLVA